MYPQEEDREPVKDQQATVKATTEEEAEDTIVIPE